MENTELLVRLILLLPLLGAVVCGLGGLFVPALRTKETLVGGLATLMVAVPFVAAVLLFVPFLGGGQAGEVVRVYTWMTLGDYGLDFAYRVDQLSLLMTLIVTGVGALIHVYATGYMHGDPGFWRFFAYLNLFIFAMLNLVLANNLVVLFLGWEGVGLCSYLLIGFWYTEWKNSAAANKAFIVNRIGDFAFLLGMFILYRALGSLDFDAVLTLPERLRAGEVSQATVNWVVLLFFFGATGKSAQIPLFVWLPDAMAGPTPVSALIHAATMVTSGLYLLARLSPVVLSAPGIMTVVALVAAATAILAATIAIAQNDIKKVLAYSTVSQLGFMFMAAGVGAFFVSIFHVMTHAFFKGCLFLGSGSVIHAMHHVEHDLQHKGVLPPHHGHGTDTPHENEAHSGDVLRQSGLPYDGPFDAQDMRTMGGLAKQMPTTHLTYFLATLSIAGFPLFAGFFSKDEILFRAFEYGYDGHAYAWLVWGVGIVTAFITAFYMMRSYMLTFQGTPRWPAHAEVHAHESPKSMTLVLVVLAFLSVVGGLLGLPAVFAHGEWNWIHHFLAGEGGPVADAAVGAHAEGFIVIEWLLLILGGAIAVGGVLLAWRAYGRNGLAYDARLQARFGALYRWWRHKYYWDEFYQKTVVRPLMGLAGGLASFDQNVVDGLVNGVARTTARFGRRLRHVQSGVVQNYAFAIVLGVVLVVALMIFV